MLSADDWRMSEEDGRRIALIGKPVMSIRPRPEPPPLSPRPVSVMGDWMRRNSFSPHWLPAKWQLPWLGYLSAILLQGLAGLLTMARHAWSPDFVLPGVVELLVVAVVALAWGAGPSLL